MKTPRLPEFLQEIAEDVGTPTYVYEEAIIADRVRILRDSLDGLPVRLLYAIKANASPAILRLLHRLNVGMECVSPAEVKLALALGVPREEIFFTPNNISDAEMHEVKEMDVLFNIGETSRFERFARAYPGSNCSLRINPEIGSGHHDFVVTGGKKSKFGIPVVDLPLVQKIANEFRVDVVGLHQHIGSGIDDHEALQASMGVLLNAGLEFPELRFVNFGGGINIPYRSSDPPFDSGGFRDTVAPILEAYLKNRQEAITFWFEPGRFLVAESGTLLSTANTIKKTEERTFAGVDSGFNQLIRPLLYGAYHSVYNLSNPNGRLNTYDLVGNVCESGDLLAAGRDIQEIREGDTIAILDAGAYGIAMASEYNLRPLPAEVWVDAQGDYSVIRQRETTDDIVARLLG